MYLGVAFRYLYGTYMDLYNIYRYLGGTYRYIGGTYRYLDGTYRNPGALKREIKTEGPYCRHLVVKRLKYCTRAVI